MQDFKYIFGRTCNPGAIKSVRTTPPPGLAPNCPCPTPPPPRRANRTGGFRAVECGLCGNPGVVRTLGAPPPVRQLWVRGPGWPPGHASFSAQSAPSAVQLTHAPSQTWTARPFPSFPYRSPGGQDGPGCVGGPPTRAAAPAQALAPPGTLRQDLTGGSEGRFPVLSCLSRPPVPVNGKLHCMLSSGTR